MFRYDVGERWISHATTANIRLLAMLILLDLLLLLLLRNRDG